MKNKALLVLGALILIGSFAGAIQYSSSQNLQSAALKSKTADEAITDKSLAKINPGSGTTGQEKVFLIGGFTGSNNVSDVYSSGDGINYTQITPSAGWFPDTYPEVEFLNGKLYFFNDNYGVYSSLDGVTWTNVVTPVFGYAYTSAVYNGKIYVMGGSLGGNSTDNNVWRFDGTNWIQLPNAAWTARAYSQSFVYQNKLWVLGGEPFVGGSGTPGLELWSFDDSTSTWTFHSNTPWVQPKSTSSISIFNDGTGTKVYLLGGYDNNFNPNQPMNEVWVFDGTTWTQKTNAPWGSGNMGESYVLNGKLFYVGGQNYLSSLSHDIWSTVDGNTWTLESTNPTWSARAYHTTAVTPKSFGCSVHANIIPNTAQLNSGTHITTYEFQVTTCANPVTLTQIDFSSSQSAGVKRSNIKLEASSVPIANPMPPVYAGATYPIFKPNYTIPAYTTQTFMVTEDIGGNIVSGSNISSNLIKMTANFGSATASWANTFPLGATVLTHP